MVSRILPMIFAPKKMKAIDIVFKVIYKLADFVKFLSERGEDFV